VAGRLQLFVALDPEFLLGQRRHHLIKPLPSSPRLSVQEARMHEWSFSSTAEWVVGALLAATIVAMVFV